MPNDRRVINRGGTDGQNDRGRSFSSAQAFRTRCSEQYTTTDHAENHKRYRQRHVDGRWPQGQGSPANPSPPRGIEIPKGFEQMRWIYSRENRPRVEDAETGFHPDDLIGRPPERQPPGAEQADRTCNRETSNGDAPGSPCSERRIGVGRPRGRDEDERDEENRVQFAEQGRRETDARDNDVDRSCRLLADQKSGARHARKRARRHRTAIVVQASARKNEYRCEA